MIPNLRKPRKEKRPFVFPRQSGPITIQNEGDLSSSLPGLYKKFHFEGWVGWGWWYNNEINKIKIAPKWLQFMIAP